MADTLKEVAAALDALDRFAPEVEATASIFVPGAAALAPFLPLLHRAVLAVDAIAKDEGKDFATTLNDVINTLTPGAPNSPTLTGPTAAAAE